jgi:hypothetical protein
MGLGVLISASDTQTKPEIGADVINRNEVQVRNLGDVHCFVHFAKCNVLAQLEGDKLGKIVKPDGARSSTQSWYLSITIKRTERSGQRSGY